MAHIVKLSIQNFRGIKDFEQTFPRDKNFICLVGRGDSGKTTILDAISSALSPAWNLAFYDTDFYNCNCQQNIEIEITLVNFPEELLSEERYGLWQRGYNPINNSISDEIADENLPAISIRLTVGKDLEPKWEVVNNRQQENKPILAKDRAKLNCFMVSDYVDRQFSWSQGNPLYSLLRFDNESFDEDDRNIIIDAVRDAKNKIDESKNEKLAGTTKKVIEQAASLGIDIEKSKTSIDFRDMPMREGRICLHDDKIPFRLKGKGSKRLISIAIQMLLVKQGGIILIDEIEQGLEPDRIKLLARTLKHHDVGQVFITTHSRDVITEIEVGDIVVILRDKEGEITKGAPFKCDNNKLQRVVRACPEAFFAKKIIVCEGATEVGICRALDRFRKKQGNDLMSFKDCAYVDGNGSSSSSRAKELNDAGFKVAVLCDSDKDRNLNPPKSELIDAGIKVYDCEANNAIEQQLFKDLPWSAVIELVDYAKSLHYNNDEKAVEASIETKYDETFPSDWRSHDSSKMREAIVAASIIKDKEWFKRTDHGEKLGRVVFEYWEKMQGKHLRTTLDGLSNWVDE